MRLGDKTHQSESLLQLARLSERLEEFENAKKYAGASLSLSIETNDQNHSAVCYTLIGTIFQKQGLLEQALEFQTKGLEMYRNIGNLGGQAGCLSNIGNVYELQERYGGCKRFTNPGIDAVSGIE